VGVSGESVIPINPHAVCFATGRGTVEPKPGGVVAILHESGAPHPDSPTVSPGSVVTKGVSGYSGRGIIVDEDSPTVTKPRGVLFDGVSDCSGRRVAPHPDSPTSIVSGVPLDNIPGDSGGRVVVDGDPPTVPRGVILNGVSGYSGGSAKNINPSTVGATTVSDGETRKNGFSRLPIAKSYHRTRTSPIDDGRSHHRRITGSGASQGDLFPLETDVLTICSGGNHNFIPISSFVDSRLDGAVGGVLG